MVTTACAEVSRDLGEDPAGTAAETSGWLVVEHDGPWTPRAPTDAELGDVADAVARGAAGADVRVQLARPVRVDGHRPARRHARDADAPRRVVLGRSGPTGGWARRTVVDDVRALLDLPLDAVEDPGPDAGASVEDLWLVCAHARRDACCAVEGRPLALALALSGREVWETTHLGGHRFAATALHLPTGLQLARVPAESAAAVADGLGAGRVDPALLRGRSGMPRPAQAAEVLHRREHDLHALDAVSVAEHRDESGGHHVVTLLLADGRHRTLHLEHAPTGTPRPVSDDAAPTDPGVWRVV